jgi:hypothetical protein
VSGTSTSSGDQMKSTESESSSHDKSTGSSHSGKKKCLSGTSPDMETSQEFTTADFYIEDSMPSSIGGSPPSVKTDDKSKKQPETQEENVETELSFYKTKLALTETKLQSLFLVFKLSICSLSLSLFSI